MTLIRCSNLITTRSDTFTVYVCVQGWQAERQHRRYALVNSRVAFIRSKPN